MSKHFFTTLIFSLLFLIFIPQAQAQTPDLNLILSPPLTHVVIQPGKKALVTATIENQGAFDVNLRPRFVDFKSDNVSGVPVLGEEMSFPNITLQDANIQMNSSFPLARGQAKQLLFEIDLPANALQTEHHFSLLFELQPDENSLGDQTQTAVAGQIASNFIVTVTTSSEDQGIIELHEFRSSLFLDSLAAIKAKVFVKNVGKNTTVTQGNLKIKNAFGTIVYENEFLPENVLPNSVRELFGSQHEIKNGEDYATQLPFRYKPAFLLGPYTLIFTYGAPGQEPQVFEHTVFALPVSLLMLVVIVAIIYFLYSKTNLFALDRKRETQQTRE